MHSDRLPFYGTHSYDCASAGHSGQVDVRPAAAVPPDGQHVPPGAGESDREGSGENCT